MAFETSLYQILLFAGSDIHTTVLFGGNTAEYGADPQKKKPFISFAKEGFMYSAEPAGFIDMQPVRNNRAREINSQ